MNQKPTLRALAYGVTTLSFILSGAFTTPVLAQVHPDHRLQLSGCVQQNGKYAFVVKNSSYNNFDVAFDWSFKSKSGNGVVGAAGSQTDPAYFIANFNPANDIGKVATITYGINETNFEETFVATGELCHPEVPASPEPTASPVPSTRESNLTTNRLSCDSSTFDAVMDVRENGQGAKDVKVVFKFNGETKELRTNQEGRAYVSFQRADGTLLADPEAFDGKSLTIDAPESCPAATGGRGQVLGATTLANTGMTQNLMAAIGSIVGSLTTLVAVRKLVKAKKA